MRKWQFRNLLNFWEKLTSGSINRKIFAAVVTVALLTALVKIVALVKESVVAWKFGTGDALDAFLIALQFPAFIINVVVAPFSTALIPTYIQVREQEYTKAAQKLLTGAIIWGMGLLGIITVVMVTSASLCLPWIASGFNPEKLNLTFHLLCALAPLVPVSGMVAISGAVFNSRERFALAALSPIITPAISVVFIFVFTSWGIFALPAGLVCGAVLEMFFLGLALHRQGIRLHIEWCGFNTHLRQVASQYLPMLTAAFLMCSTGLVDQSMAAMLLPGSVAALSYGNRLIISILSLMATAVNTATLPYFSKMVASKDWVGIRHTFTHYMRLIFLITVPMTLIFFLLSEPIVQIFFQRGSFTEQDSRLVAQIQALYALQIPFYLGDILVVGLIKALRLSQILIWVCGINLLLNITLNYMFTQWLGVKGIALSTSCVYIFSFLCVFFFANKRLKQATT